jgi:hypothetical protein
MHPSLSSGRITKLPFIPVLLLFVIFWLLGGWLVGGSLVRTEWRTRGYWGNPHSQTSDSPTRLTLRFNFCVVCLQVGVQWILLPLTVQNTSSENTPAPFESYPRRISTWALARAIVVFLDTSDKCRDNPWSKASTADPAVLTALQRPTLLRYVSWPSSIY